MPARRAAMSPSSTMRPISGPEPCRTVNASGSRILSGGVLFVWSSATRILRGEEEIVQLLREFAGESLEGWSDPAKSLIKGNPHFRKWSIDRYSIHANLTNNSAEPQADINRDREKDRRVADDRGAPGGAAIAEPRRAR